MKPKLPKGHPLSKVRESFAPSAGQSQPEGFYCRKCKKKLNMAYYMNGYCGEKCFSESQKEYWDKYNVERKQTT